VRDEQYRSGGDYRLDFLGRLYEFSRTDFEQRLVAAARRLGLTDGAGLDGSETPTSWTWPWRGGSTRRGRRSAATSSRRRGRPAARRRRSGVLAAQARVPLAWIDHRVRHGLVEARFEEAHGSFSYLVDGHRLPYSDDRDVPRWPAVRYRR
jgi:hypothetical protein